jgi:hypothetical protein
MAISRGQLVKELEPGLNALFGLEYKRYENQHAEIFDTETSDRAFEEEVMLSGFANAMKKYLVQIRSRGYFTKFEITCEDNDKSFNDAIIDKVGQSDIVWEESRFYNKRKTWITYEEVNDANTRSIPLQTEEGLRTTVGAAL